MTNDIRKLLAGYVDGELTNEEKMAVEQALAESPELQTELEEFRKLKEVTGMAQYADLPDEVWETYWESIYKKLERGIGWIFFSVGAIVLLGFGLYEVFSQLYLDPDAPLWTKIGLTALAVGSAVLLVSFGRERWFAYKRDRYGKVLK
ncbi:MAG: zf-HC2 domain-containing protein [candidate division Zixibacteria bacterium]|nr:zf-HC2 domain-containing protein [candidate division Zixibacteria bacterium]